MTDDSRLDASEDELVDLLSAWLDGELDTASGDDVEEILSSSPRARDLLAALTAGRDAARGVAGREDLFPTPLEAARVDRAVLGAPPPRQSGRVSPSKRGRSPAPYFAVAAVIAVALMAGIVVLTRSISTTGPDEAAGTATEEEKGVEDFGAPDAAGGADSSGAMSPNGFFVSDVPADGPEDLQMLLGAQASVAAAESTGGGAPSLSDVSPEEDLLRAAGGLEGFEDLASCLAAVRSSVVPRRVDTGTWRGEPAYFVSGVDTAGRPAVVVVARSGCAPVLTVT